jgi:hypothetical protein
MESIKSHLTILVNSHHNFLSNAEMLYFQRSLKLFHRLPIFYGLPKVHKNPYTLRPVISGTNSLLAIFSNWLDYKLKELLIHVKSFVKDSNTIMKELKDLTLPENALFFTADAASMYTNIDTSLGVESIKQLIHDHLTSLPPDFPTSLLLEVLTIVMKHNIFTFADTFWLQLSGTAMGTPVACTYAMLSFGHYENTKLLPELNSNLYYYRRYIDDVLVIWIPDQHNNEARWEHFTATLNNWGSLWWKVQDPSLQVQFLDLSIQKEKTGISFETFQ